MCIRDRYSTTWRSDHRAVHQSAQYHMVVRSSCSPPVNTTTWGRGQIMHTFHQSTRCHMAISSLSIAPVNSPTWRSDHQVLHQSTVPHGGQIIKYCTGQQYHTAVRSSSTAPVNSTTWRSDHQVLHWSTLRNRGLDRVEHGAPYVERPLRGD